MIALFLGYLLAISIGIGIEQTHKAKKDCQNKIGIESLNK